MRYLSKLAVVIESHELNKGYQSKGGSESSFYGSSITHPNHGLGEMSGSESSFYGSPMSGHDPPKS